MDLRSHTLRRSTMPAVSPARPHRSYFVRGLLGCLLVGSLLWPVAYATPRQPVAPAQVLESQTPRLAHLAKLGVDRWHQEGFRGQGVKIAVLDSGFRGYRNFLGKGLPAKVTARSFRADGNLEARDSQHGILCGEVLHALAPD